MSGAPPLRPSQTQDRDPQSPSGAKRPGAWPPRMEPPPTDQPHSPRVLGTWARRTGFKSNIAGESGSTVSDIEINSAEAAVGSKPKTMGSTNPIPPRNLQNDNLHSNGVTEREKSKAPVAPTANLRPVSVPLLSGKKVPDPEAVNPSGFNRPESISTFKESEVDMMSQSQEADDGSLAKHSHMKYDLIETPGFGKLPRVSFGSWLCIAAIVVFLQEIQHPGRTDCSILHNCTKVHSCIFSWSFTKLPSLYELAGFFLLTCTRLLYHAVPLMLYGVQHYLSIAGSLVLIPLVIVPAMGGTDVSSWVEL